MPRKPGDAPGSEVLRFTEAVAQFIGQETALHGLTSAQVVDQMLYGAACYAVRDGTSGEDFARSARAQFHDAAARERKKHVTPRKDSPC